MLPHRISTILFIFYWCSLGGGTKEKRHTTTCNSNTKFECPSGECLDRDHLCDGKPDCRDGADETPSTCGCGLSLSLTKSVVVNAPGVTDAKAGAHPWHVGVYRTRANNHYTLLCSASLIYNDIVITSANCVHDLETLLPFEASAIRVSVGKLKRDYNMKENSEQKSNVSNIVILDGYDGDTKGYIKNLALLHLSEPFKINHFVRPICLWNEKNFPESSPTATITGWGLQYIGNYGANLRQAYVKLMDIISCLRTYMEPLNKMFLTQDKFCLNFNQGTGMKDDDTGGPVSMLFEGRYYLLGVISVKLNGETNYAIATRIYKYINWIQNQTIQLKKKSSCSRILNHFHCGEGECITVDQLCDGKQDCSNGFDENSANCVSKNNDFEDEKGRCEIPEGKEIYEVTGCNHPKGCHSKYYAPDSTSFKIKCPTGYGLEFPEQEEISTICFNGTWFPYVKNPCRKLCPGLVIKSLDISCHYLGRHVACQDSLRPSTRIRIQCKTHYKREPQVVFVNETTCRLDGTIAHILTECIPVCGIPNDVDKGQVLISNGKVSKPGKYPWHVALYWKVNNEWEYKCGGTIISVNKILTAAHCLYDSPKSQFITARDLTIVSGKFHSSWFYNDPPEQRVGVLKVIPGEHYNGAETRHAQDIAVLVLKHDVRLNAFTLPACLDLDSSFGGIPEDQMGHVAGWGKINSGDQEGSNVLRETELKYMDLETCRQKFSKSSFRSFLLSDKFCVIYINESGTQVGDSGGGFTFTHGELHYIYGVVSVKPKDSNQFAAFTNVLWHSQWLKNILSTSYS